MTFFISRSGRLYLECLLEQTLHNGRPQSIMASPVIGIMLNSSKCRGKNIEAEIHYVSDRVHYFLRDSVSQRRQLTASRQHNVVPESPLVENITEVALAFMRSDTFNNPTQSEWPIFTTIDEVRPKFANGTIIQVAIGGWGDTDGFSAAAKTEESRKLFAKNVRAMLDTTGADGMKSPAIEEKVSANCTQAST